MPGFVDDVMITKSLLLEKTVVLGIIPPVLPVLQYIY